MGLSLAGSRMPTRAPSYGAESSRSQIDDPIAPNDVVQTNLWEHAFTHPTSPLFDKLNGHAGNYAVFGGRVPDFAEAATRQIFGDYHEEHLVDLGVSGFKLDECDNSDFTGSWSFPELSRYPSGLDGEQIALCLRPALSGRDPRRVFQSRQAYLLSGAVQWIAGGALSVCALQRPLRSPRLHSCVGQLRIFGFARCPEVRDGENIWKT